MDMYCRNCRKMVRTKTNKDKESNKRTTSYSCKECGVILLRIYSNRGF